MYKMMIVCAFDGRIPFFFATLEHRGVKVSDADIPAIADIQTNAQT